MGNFSKCPNGCPRMTRIQITFTFHGDTIVWRFCPQQRLKWMSIHGSQRTVLNLQLADLSLFLGSGTLLTRKFQGPFDLFFIVEQHVGRLWSFEAFFSTLTDGNERQFLPATMTPLSVIRCTRVREFLSGILLPFNDREKQYIFYKFLMAS